MTEDEREPHAEVEAPAAEAPPEPTRPEPKHREPRGVGVWSTVVAALAAAAAFLVFVAQNTDRVHVTWTVWDVHVPLAAVVFGAMLLGSALTLLTGAVWRIRRRRRLREREELHRLRAGRG